MATTQPTTRTGGSGTPGTDAGMKDFVPIGVWVCSWADIFPWLATGYCHAIDDTTDAETMVKFRMMAQDFLTLGRLYRYAADLKLLIPDEPVFEAGDGSVCRQIAGEFANAYASLVDAEPAEPADYKRAATTAHNLLGQEGKKIYEIWDQAPYLRNAELGLGYMKGDQSLKTWGGENQFNLGKGSSDFNQWVPLRELTFCNFARCTFAGSNFSVFADFYKLLPLILPQSGKIIAFGECGFIVSGTLKYRTPFWEVPGGYASPPDLTGGNIFSMASGQRKFETDSHRGVQPLPTTTDTAPVEFKFVANGNYLESTDHTIKLYPIPFSAAAGNIQWKGQSFSTSVKADEELNQRLAKIVKELGDTTAIWSWSSDALPDAWSAEAPYDPITLHREYFGLAMDPKQ